MSGSKPETPEATPVRTPPPSATPPPEPRPLGGWLGVTVRAWVQAYRVEIAVFALAFAVLASFSSFRFLRQSEAPHFVYQAQAWLEGRLDIDRSVLPTVLEDWACVREAAGEKVRCVGAPRPGDRWYSSFPPFPALVMLPFVAVNGYQLNDTSFTVIAGALALAFFYSLLRFLSHAGESDRSERDNLVFTAVLGSGSLFFYCAIRGEVWFTAEVLGVALTCPFIRNSVQARRPALAGLFFAMATLTRTPLAFAGVFFLIECLCPGPEPRLQQLRTLSTRWEPVLRKLGLFVAGAAPLALLAAASNAYRFGSFTEFGHSFLYANRVNADIDRFGLFDAAYLTRNLEAAFLLLPRIQLSPLRLEYSPWGMSLLLTMPWLVLLLWPRRTAADSRRLTAPLWLSVAACALPGFFYQNTGYMQFGYRFALDYTPYLVLLLALSGWSTRSRLLWAPVALAVAVNVWGAAAFRGYTELVRYG